MDLSFQNVDTFCAEIDLNQERPVVDLSQLGFIWPFAVIYLGQFIRYHNRRRKFFNFIMPPEGTKVREYFARIRFWPRFNFSAETIRREGMLRFASPSPTSFNDIVELLRDPYVGEETAQLVKDVLAGANVNVNIAAVLEVVAELADNFAQHAQVDLATLAVQYFPRLRQFTVAVGDSGVGIRHTLSENQKYAHLADRPHSEAIVTAFHPLASRRPEGGMGLNTVRDLVLGLGGNLRVASNDGFLYMERGKTVSDKQQYELPGVQIEATFPEERGDNGHRD